MRQARQPDETESMNKMTMRTLRPCKIQDKNGWITSGYDRLFYHTTVCV